MTTNERQKPAGKPITISFEDVRYLGENNEVLKKISAVSVFSHEKMDSVGNACCAIPQGLWAPNLWVFTISPYQRPGEAVMLFDVHIDMRSGCTAGEDPTSTIIEALGFNEDDLRKIHDEALALYRSVN